MAREATTTYGSLAYQSSTNGYQFKLDLSSSGRTITYKLSLIMGGNNRFNWSSYDYRISFADGQVVSGAADINARYNSTQTICSGSITVDVSSSPTTVSVHLPDLQHNGNRYGPPEINFSLAVDVDYTPPTYTISYSANGGTSTPAAQTKYRGQTLTLRGAISRNSVSSKITTTFDTNYNGIHAYGTSYKTISYSFAHWAASNGGTYSASGSYTKDQAATMTAGWSSSTSYSAVSFPSAPTRTGYTFAGWYTASSGGSQVTSHSPHSNNTLYAHWSINSYTNSVSHWVWGLGGYGNNSGKTAFLIDTTYFTRNYGAGFQMNNNDMVSVPNGFYHEKTLGTNYGGGWNAYPIPSNFTQPAYALSFEYDYYPYSYSITYNYNGGTPCSNPTSYNVLFGVTFKNPTRSYYTFAGWKMDGNWVSGINKDKVPPVSSQSTFYNECANRTTGNKTVVAYWTPNTYSIYYDGNGGTTPSGQTKTADQTLTLRPASTRSNSYRTITTTFNSNMPGGTSSTKESTATTVYSFAHWKDNQGTTYSGGGSYTKNYGNTLTAIWTSSTSYSAVSLPTISRTYYDFDGWYTAPSGGSKVTSYRPSSNTTLYAHWIPHKYQIKYYANGGTSTPASQIKTADITLILQSGIAHNDTYKTITTTFNQNYSGAKSTTGTSTETTHYSFKYWQDNQKTLYVSQGAYTKNDVNTMTALWNYTYTYSNVTLPIPPRRLGYHFLGWFTSPSGGSKITSYAPHSNTTLYAHWEKYSEAVIYIYSNGAWHEYLPYIYINGAWRGDLPGDN